MKLFLIGLLSFDEKIFFYPALGQYIWTSVSPSSAEEEEEGFAFCVYMNSLTQSSQKLFFFKMLVVLQFGIFLGHPLFIEDIRAFFIRHVAATRKGIEPVRIFCTIFFQERVDIVFLQIFVGDVIAEYLAHERCDPFHAAMLYGGMVFLSAPG